MSTSIKIRKNINMSSKNIVFKGAETGKFAKSHVGKRPKVNMGQPIKLALNSIPATNVVTGDIFQIAKMNVVKRILGSIPTVVGSKELFKPENLGENAKRNFGENVYHETSGVHEEAEQGRGILIAATKDVKIAVYGWEEINGKWKYHDGTKYAKGWKKIDGKWYYFDSYEYMVTGWRSIGGNIYYFKAKKDVEGESGYGYMWEGWRKIDGKWYYFHNDGAMRTGWKIIDDKWYYFHNDGAMRTGWEIIKGKWYYFHEDGHMAQSEEVLGNDGKIYNVDENGVCINDEENEWNRKIDSFVDIALNETYEKTNFVEKQIDKKVKDSEGNYKTITEGDNKTIYGEWYNLNKKPWCANKAGILNNKQIAGETGKPVPKFASCLN